MKKTIQIKKSTGRIPLPEKTGGAHVEKRAKLRRNICRIKDARILRKYE